MRLAEERAITSLQRSGILKPAEELLPRPKTPYFVEHMALTAEEKSRRLITRREFIQQHRPKSGRRGREKQNPTRLVSVPPPVVSHVGRRPWDYSSVPVQPQHPTVEAGSSSDEEQSDVDGSEAESTASVTSSVGSPQPQGRNDPELLRPLLQPTLLR